MAGEGLVERPRDVLVDRRQPADHPLDLRVDLRVARGDVDGAEVDGVGRIHVWSLTSMSSLLTSRDPFYSLFTSRDFTSKEGRHDDRPARHRPPASAGGRHPPRPRPCPDQGASVGEGARAPSAGHLPAPPVGYSFFLSIPKTPRATCRSSALPCRDFRNFPRAAAPWPRASEPPSPVPRRAGASFGRGAADFDAGATDCSIRAASISRALCASTRWPYFANNGDDFAAPATSSAGAIRDVGARSLVCTTGVGTPFSDRIVTAASPMPSWVNSSPRS